MSASTAPAATARCARSLAQPSQRRGETRRLEIATAAELVFFEHGYSDTTMQAIAARAGASKETLYRHFGSKEGLFAEIVARRSRSFLHHLDQNFERPGSVAEVLRELGLRILDSMLETTALGLCRTVIAEANRNPEIGAVFLRDGPDHVRLRLADFLGAAVGRGELSCPDTERAARIFLGAVIGSFHLSLLASGERPVLTRDGIAGHVDECVAMFLSRHALPAA